jgi:hypothetical protein
MGTVFGDVGNRHWAYTAGDDATTARTAKSLQNHLISGDLLRGRFDSSGSG